MLDVFRGGAVLSQVFLSQPAVHHPRVGLLQSRPRKRYDDYGVPVTVDFRKSCAYFCPSSVAFTDGQCFSHYYSLNRATLINLGRVYLMGSVQSPAVITRTILSCLSLICFPVQSLFLSRLVSSSHGPLATSDCCCHIILDKVHGKYRVEILLQKTARRKALTCK